MLLGDRNVVALITPARAPLAGFLSTRARDLSCIGRGLGDAALFLGDLAAAKRYYQQGLEVCQKARFRPEIALIRLGLAEVLLKDPETHRHPEVQQHLDFAIGELREMKMQPGLERALKHKGLLTA